MRVRRYPGGHRLGRQTMARCSMVGCPYRAEFCEYAPKHSYCAGAMSLYCSGHWHEPSPGIASTPHERAAGEGAAS